MGAFDNTIGVLFVGLLVSVALWGVSCTQTWNYYRDFPQDSWHVKTLVAVAWTADSIHQALVSHMMYTLLISDFAQPQKLEVIVKTLPISIPFLQIAVSGVQGFFAWRILRLSGSTKIAYCVCVAIAVQFGLALAYTVRTMACVTFIDLNARMGLMTIAYSAMDAFNGVFITSIMCWLLHTHRTTHNRTNTIINRLIFFAFSSGASTAIAASGLFIARLALPLSPVYLFFYFVIGRLYVNSLMASLNMRAQLRFHDVRRTKASVSTIGPIRAPDVTSYKDTLDELGHELSIKFATRDGSANEAASNMLYSSHGRVPVLDHDLV